MQDQSTQFRCVIHGSFSKHFAEIKHASEIFSQAGIAVLAPKNTDITAVENGFAYFAGEEQEDPRFIELRYLHNVKNLRSNGFSYFVNPHGYIGKTTSYELGIAQLTNVPCFFQAKPVGHPAYLHANSIWQPEGLAEFISTVGQLPSPKIKRNEKMIHKLWEDLMVPGSVIAVGGIIEHENARRKEKDLLLVKTHKWGNRYSIIGGKVRRNERLDGALAREIKEEIGLAAHVGDHLATFDQFKDSGYYIAGFQQIFVDNIVSVGSKRVQLNDEAQDYVWAPASIALTQLDIEPNARHTLELYAKRMHLRWFAGSGFFYRLDVLFLSKCFFLV